MRVVLDTDILVSALGFGGRTAKIRSLVEEGRFILFTSRCITEPLKSARGKGTLLKVLKFGGGKARHTALCAEMEYKICPGR